MDWKQFLTSKSLTQEEFDALEVAKMAVLRTEYEDARIKALSDRLDSAVKAEDITKATKELLAFMNKNKDLNLGTINKLVKDVDEAMDKLSQIEEGATGSKSVDGSFVKFVKENVEKYTKENKQYGSAMTIKAAALMTTTNVTPNVVGGFSPLYGNYIDDAIGSVPKADPFVLPLVSVTNQPGTESIWYVDRVNEEGDAEFIAEGALKPLADAEWATSKVDVKEVAERWKFSKRLMNHAPAIVNDFRNHANDLIENKIDDKLVDGDTGATPTEPNGLQTLGAAFVVPPQLANYYIDANIFDVINACATLVRLNNFKGQLTAVLNTVWKAQMQGLKKSDGEYIVPPFVTADGKTVGETRVVFTNRLPDTDIICGDLKKFKVVFSENIEYDEGYENDDFSRNLVSRKLEAFLGTYMNASDAGSIIVDAVATIVTAIDAP